MPTELSRSALVQILARMPDLWMRTLGEHGPDAAGSCLSCRRRGVRAAWPCLAWRIADAAQHVAGETRPRHRLR